ncbi:MAG: hypothetical protein KAR45_15790, partial [Desulfobacteraceae bacterium]|nr:hypothetical protein [Desulfobacteraceae bacterium]
SLSDDYEKGLIIDISSFKEFSKSIALEICNNNMKDTKEIINENDIPLIINIALNALFNGVYHRNL